MTTDERLVNGKDLSDFWNNCLSTFGKILDIYPVGSIYTSISSTSPASLFGGTWQRINDTFLWATSDNAQLGQTGGSANHNHTLNNGYAMVTLHSSGDIWTKEKIGITAFTANYKVTANSGSSGSYYENVGAQLGGSTDNESNMPPYLIVCMWKRIA